MFTVVVALLRKAEKEIKTGQLLFKELKVYILKNLIQSTKFLYMVQAAFLFMLSLQMVPLF